MFVPGTVLQSPQFVRAVLTAVSRTANASRFRFFVVFLVWNVVSNCLNFIAAFSAF